MKKQLRKASLIGLLSGLATLWLTAVPIYALDLKGITETSQNLLKGTGSSSNIINTFLLLTILSVIPMLLIMTTSFTRIIMVLSFVRSALGTQQNPPNQVLIGLALFLTFFTMKPVYTDIYQQAVVPYNRQEISQQQLVNRSENRLKEFMGKQTRKTDIKLFMETADQSKQAKATIKVPQNAHKIPMSIMIPAFIISEMRTAFSIGFLIFIPFLIIDMVVSSILMSMGMVMLSPVMISLPFKLLLFVLVDGWYLLVESLVKSFS